MRKSGILLHISSLASPYGIGTMGKQAREFVDFLEKSKQLVWQILPICPTSYGDSPYQSFSTYAGNPYFIDLDELCEQGLLEKNEYQNINWGENPNAVDFDILYKKRFEVLSFATKRLYETRAFEVENFANKNNFWLEDYAVFMALKNYNNGASWQTWQTEIKNRDELALNRAKFMLKSAIDFWKAVQFLFFEQWYKLKDYANSKSIKIVGDVPIYVALDSVDVWANPQLFQLDENLSPIEVAGCPPDGFSADGQLWGNPLYNWDKMKEDDYSWWVQRIKACFDIYDVLRIDHFRGFEAYYAIPYGDTTAQNGYWKQGPNKDLFIAIENALGKKEIIAEDLGFLTDEVRNLLNFTGFPGMKILQFAFDSRDGGSENYLPHVYTENSIAYIGTHDNAPIKAWFEDESISEDTKKAKEYFALTNEEGYNWGMMRGLWSSKSMLTVVQMQDILNLGLQSRMNTPSTLGNNWIWRMDKDSLTEELSEKLSKKMELYSRI